MTAPTTDYILGWHAAIEAAAETAQRFSDYDYAAMNYPEEAGMAASGTAHEVEMNIRALPPPGDLRAALAALVKPLVWETDPRWTGTEWGVPTFDGQYQINDQCDGSWLLTKPNGDDILTDTLEAARAAAEEDHRRRVVAAIMGDEG